MARRKPFRWHIGVFLAPAVLVYTAIMIIPLFGTLNLSLYNLDGQNRIFVGMANFSVLFGDPRWSDAFWNALGNNFWFFVIHMLVQNPIGILLAALLSNPRLRMAAFYRTAIFIPTILSFVIVGFVWKLILSPIWGIATRSCPAREPVVWWALGMGAGGPFGRRGQSSRGGGARPCAGASAGTGRHRTG